MAYKAFTAGMLVNSTSGEAQSIVPLQMFVLIFSVATVETQYFVSLLTEHVRTIRVRI